MNKFMLKSWLLFLCCCWGISVHAQSISQVTANPNPVDEGGILSVSISGTNTHFLQGSAILQATVGGTQVYGYVTSIADDLNMTGQLNLPCGVCGTADIVVINTIDGILPYANAFTVNCSEILSVTPDTLSVGQGLTVGISGTGLTFGQGSYFGAVLENSTTGASTYSSNVNIINVDSAQVTFNSLNNVCTGIYDVCVWTANGCRVCLDSSIYINGTDTGQINIVNPDTITTGQPLSVGISGTGLNFSQGSSVWVYFENQNTGQSYYANTTIINSDSIDVHVPSTNGWCGGDYDVLVYANWLNCPTVGAGMLHVAGTHTAQITSVTHSNPGNSGTLSVNISGTGLNFYQGSNISVILTNTADGTTITNSGLWGQGINGAYALFYNIPQGCHTYDLSLIGANPCDEQDTVFYPNAVSVNTLPMPTVYLPATNSTTTSQLYTMNLTGYAVDFGQSAPGLIINLEHTTTGNILQGTNITSTGTTTGTVDFNIGANDCGTYNIIIDSINGGCNNYFTRTLYNGFQIFDPSSPQITSVIHNSSTIQGQPVIANVTALNLDFNTVSLSDIYLRSYNTQMKYYAQSITVDPNDGGIAEINFGTAVPYDLYDFVVDNIPNCNTNQLVVLNSVIVGVVVGTGKVSENPITVNVFPNPMDQTATVKVESAKDELVRFEVYDMLGQLVKSEAFTSNTNYTFDRAELTAGMYVYRLSTSTGTQIKVGKIELR